MTRDGIIAVGVAIRTILVILDQTKLAKNLSFSGQLPDEQTSSNVEERMTIIQFEPGSNVGLGEFGGEFQTLENGVSIWVNLGLVQFGWFRLEQSLPADIPIPKESKYKFSNFSPDAEWAVDIGEAAAVNRELEVRLGSRVDGLKLVERGPEMEAIVHVFETWTKRFPGDVILEKWVDDTLEAARGLILAAGKAVS
ncbi:hypothetical protein DEU56DRAFT_758780 [Suillus clintonianus]|uniref:uncharacterized protein n=1 Tax=Suillus clintonianus TaxID=1904413 RepID=UPI001B86F4DB|nr:uncharacterized protein DEU56DRAFT_758780 [Suillus clintonianus]KAG2126796.1 hypothetical protein DEU56DRAFT_758780 [Suillus clintonianus]